MSYAAPGQPAEDPGRTLGIVGLVLSIVLAFVLLGVVGLIISIVGLRKSRKVGFQNGVALAGVIVGTVTTMGAIIVIALIIGFLSASSQLAQQCQGHPNMPIQISGTTVQCPANS